MWNVKVKLLYFIIWTSGPSKIEKKRKNIYIVDIDE